MTIDFSRPQQLIDVGHSRLAYWKFAPAEAQNKSVGTGPDVVFIHGWPLTAATYRHVVARLADRFTCHLFDLPGAGATEVGPATQIGIVEHAATIRAAIDRLGLSRYALVAHDSGGFIARLLAADDPRAVGLVLSNTEVPDHSPFLIGLFAVLAKLGLAASAFRLVLGSSRGRRSALGFGGCFTDSSYADGEFKTVHVDPLLASPRVLAGQLRLLTSLSPKLMALLPDVHARLVQPIALVWGTDDPWFPLANAKRMVAGIAGPVTFVEIPGGKLFVHEDRADELANAAAQHLARCFDVNSPIAPLTARINSPSAAPTTASRTPLPTPRATSH